MKAPDIAPVIALFVKAPIPGRVKTRLIPQMGQDGACRLYRAMVADLLGNLRACPFPLYLFYDGAERQTLPPDWVAASTRLVVQEGCDIGERMAAAFEHCFAEDIRQVILIGSDIPGLDAGRLIAAAAALATHDGVLTPVADGGYCLIGLKSERYRRRIFEDIRWSTSQVLATTLQRFAASDLSVHLQSPLRDIDTIADIERYCRNPCAAASATNRFLAGQGWTFG